MVLPLAWSKVQLGIVASYKSALRRSRLYCCPALIRAVSLLLTKPLSTSSVRPCSLSQTLRFALLLRTYDDMYDLLRS